MATNLQDIETGSIEQAADRLKAQREETQLEALETPEVEEITEPEEGSVDELEALPEEEESEEIEPEAEEAEADLFADDLDEAPLDTLDAPAAFSKEGKELFLAADPGLQKEITARLKASERGATQKVQQAQRREQEVEAAAQQVIEMRNELQTRLANLGDTLPEPPNPDLVDPNSDNYDPDQYNLQNAHYERAKRAAEASQEERRKVAEENTRLSEDQQKQFRAESARRIVGYFPTWNTREKLNAGVKGVQEFLASEGIDPNVAAQIIDADMIRISYMAKRYTEIKGKVRGKTPPKPSKPTGRVKRTQSATSVAQAEKAHKEAGTVESATALLRATR